MYKNVNYKYCSYTLRPQNSDLSVLSNGDLVSFIAKEKADIYNPQKSYWMACDIRLKLSKD